MKKLLLALVALAFMPAAWACDTYTSTAKAPGARTLTLIDDGLEFVIREDGKELLYSTGSAGTGMGIRVAFPEDETLEPMEIQEPEGEYWLGPEKFVEYCN